jgi:hypothetical protein
LGVVENMKMNDSKTIQQETQKLGLKFLEEIPYDSDVEAAIGDPDELLQTALADKVKHLCSKILENPTSTNLGSQQSRKRKE